MSPCRPGLLGPLLAATGLLISACTADDGSETGGTEPAVVTPSAPDSVTPELPPTDSEVGGPTATEPPTTSSSAPSDPEANGPTTTQPPTADSTTPTDSEVSGPSSTQPPTTDSSAPATTVVNTYWAWTIGNPPVCCAEKIAAGSRTVDDALPTRGALEVVLEGPNPIEQEIGMSTTIPDGTRLLDLAVADGTAIVDLSSEFEEPSGSLIERFRVAQIVFTLTQFDDIERVRFRVDGTDREELMPHGIPVDDGLTRNSDLDIRPGVLVEAPHPGASVSDPLVIRGESNTFEATVEYVVTSAGGDGVIIAEGFTSATAGNGEWGSFEAVVDLDTGANNYRAGPGAVIVYETSPEDGSSINVVEYPVVLPEPAPSE